MSISENVSLQPYNTFGFDVQARYLVNATSLDELKEGVALAQAQQLPMLVLGGGSNVILAKDYPGVVVRVALRGRELVSEDAEHYLLRVAAGENWHELVRYCVAHDYYGLENLSLIPGTAGAAPIQNIGAYGVEIKNAFHALEALEIATGHLVRFDHTACAFGYRDSVFKRHLKDQFIITSVTFRLRREPALVLTHQALVKELAARGITEPTARLVSDTIITIRQRNLPDPSRIGNAGSFFMNPVVQEEVYQKIKTTHPHAPGFPAGEGRVKLAAGWLVDQCGYKGKRFDDAGVFPNNALVLVNYGKASATDVLSLAEQIQKTVRDTFGVDLVPEPRIY
jgi:UDP-N-acetylmuramate dehydrogenase